MTSPAPLVCADCGATLVLRASRYGPFYGCTRYPACKGSHGAHPDGRPLGIPATTATKQARIAAHAAFDALWLDPASPLGTPQVTRVVAYAWLAAQLGMPPAECHIGRFDAATCGRVVACCRDATIETLCRWQATTTTRGV